jgi:hypothetical protein
MAEPCSSHSAFVFGGKIAGRKVNKITYARNTHATTFIHSIFRVKKLCGTPFLGQFLEAT